MYCFVSEILLLFCFFSVVVVAVIYVVVVVVVVDVYFTCWGREITGLCARQRRTPVRLENRNEKENATKRKQKRARHTAVITVTENGILIK